MHLRTPKRRLAAAGFAATAAVLAAASVSYACVQVIGRMEVTGSDGVGKSVGIGSGVHPPYGIYCVPATADASAPRATSFANRPAITVSYGPASDCNPIPPGESAVRPGRANTPSDGSYDVMYADGKMFQFRQGEWEFIVWPDRGSPFFTDAVTDRAVLMGTMAVTAGSGSGTYRIPFGAAKSGPNNRAAVSVRRTGPGPNPAGGPPDVNIVPIAIL